MGKEEDKALESFQSAFETVAQTFDDTVRKVIKHYMDEAVANGDTERVRKLEELNAKHGVKLPPSKNSRE